MTGSRRTALALGALVLCAACAGSPSGSEPAPPADLPTHVRLKTRTESFTHAWSLALRDGRIWRRPNTETTGQEAPWVLLPPDGRARHGSARGSSALRELSADGENLIAVDDDGLVYYTKLDPVDWIETWGLPPRGAPLRAPQARAALAISHRGPLVGGYEDIDGNHHPISAGVTSLYLLEADGRTLRYADPWLPSGFVRRLCLPLRDRFIAAALSASASTLFVIDRRGRMFTRIADYDTLGENPVLPYTYERGLHEGQSARVLPPEHWAEQPPVPGRITTRITILQTGHGNAGRELRVEGVDAEGAGGYFYKSIHGGEWRFVPTDAEVAGPFASASVPDEAVLGPRRDVDLDGWAERPELEDGVRFELRGFHPVCPPAVLRVLAGEAHVDLTLHMRDTDRDEAGRITSLDGTLLVARDASLSPGLARALDVLFGSDARLVEAEVKVEADGTVVLERSIAEKNLLRPFRLVFRGAR